MFIDLHEIIEVPGASVPFRFRMEEDRLAFPALVRFTTPPEAEGIIRNVAGVLTLTGSIRADMLLRCDRCGREYADERRLPVEATLADRLEDEDDAEVFLLEGNGIDLDMVLSTCFILDMDSKFLCREDCKGLCPGCGADLNEGPCSCRKTTDPRMAVLEQLLDDK